VGEEHSDRSAAFYAKWVLARRFILRSGAVARFDRLQNRVEDPGITGQERHGHRQLLGVEGRQVG
jgi:hypothetical protein